MLPNKPPEGLLSSVLAGAPNENAGAVVGAGLAVLEPNNPPVDPPEVVSLFSGGLDPNNPPGGAVEPPNNPPDGFESVEPKPVVALSLELEPNKPPESLSVAEPNNPAPVLLALLVEPNPPEVDAPKPDVVAAGVLLPNKPPEGLAAPNPLVWVLLAPPELPPNENPDPLLVEEELLLLLELLPNPPKVLFRLVLPPKLLVAPPKENAGFWPELDPKALMSIDCEEDVVKD